MREINTERGLCPAWISSVPLADPRGHRTIALEYKAIRLKIGETLKNIKEKLPGGERKTRKTPWHCLARWLERSGFLAHACSRYHAPPGSLHTPTKTVCSICPASYVTCVYLIFRVLALLLGRHPSIARAFSACSKECAENLNTSVRLRGTKNCPSIIRMRRRPVMVTAAL